MENFSQNLLIAILCNYEGTITEVISNELGLADLAVGRLWVSTVDPNSSIKALNFLREIQVKKVVSDWNLNIRVNGQIQVLHFTGWLVENLIYIVGSPVSMAVDDAYMAGLLSINNEQANFIRAFIKEYQVNLQFPPNREPRDFDEFSRLNNELVNLQRELIRKNAELEENRLLIRHILETTPEIIYIYDLSTRKSTFVNRMVEVVLGFYPTGEEELYPGLLNTTVHPGDMVRLNEYIDRLRAAEDGKVEEIEYRVKDAWDNWRWVACRSTVFNRDNTGNPISVIGTAQDQTERKLIQEKLVMMSTHDILTGIYNRFYFEIEMERLGKSRDFPISVVMADLDGLKIINDTQGHAAGDALIVLSSRLLKDNFRAGDIVARLGGDEFGILLPDTSPEVVEQIMLRVKQTFDLHNRDEEAIQVNFSFGWKTVYAGESLEDGLRQADQAMYREKSIRKQKGVSIR